MMRVAGRDDFGLAKAIKTDKKGRLEVFQTNQRPVFNRATTVAANSNVLSPILFGDGYDKSKLNLMFSGTRAIKIDLINLQKPSSPPSKLFEGTATEFLSVEYPIYARYQIRVTSKDIHGVYLLAETSESLYVKESTSIIRNYDRTLFEIGLYKKGTKYTSATLSSEGFSHGRTLIQLTQNRNVRVSILEVVDNAFVPRVIYEGLVQSNKLIKYNIKSRFYRIEIEALDDLYIHRNVYETLYNGDLEDLAESANANIFDLSSKVLTKDIFSKMTKKVRFPDGGLKFRKSPLDIKILAKGIDDGYYAQLNNLSLAKYSDITSNDPPIETGITWNPTEYGIIQHFFALSDGFVYFTDKWVNGVQTPLIYRADSINSTPILVYEPGEARGWDATWSQQFGVDYYDDGINATFLAGEYGAGRNPRNLVLSSDGGRTFSIVKKSANGHPRGNSHWHDVAIDVHRGLIWASQGDGVGSRYIYYSENLGATWKTLSGDYQPTAILPYPNKVVFGRDNNLVGLDAIDTDNNFSDLKGRIYEDYVLKGESSARYFPMRPAEVGRETYVNFLLMEGAETHQVIIASGDFGNSWHVVHFSARGKELFNFALVDKERVYIYEKNNYGGGGVLYADRLVWSES